MTLPELARQGDDVNWADGEGYAPLMYAANLGLLENVKTLLSLGADPLIAACDGSTPLSMPGNRYSPDSVSVATLLRERIVRPR